MQPGWMAHAFEVGPASARSALVSEARPDRSAAPPPSLGLLRNSLHLIETFRSRITLCGETPRIGGSHMATDPERVKALFLAAIERGDPANRRAFVDAEAADEPELRDRLNALLAAYDQPPKVLDRPLGPAPAATDASRSVNSPLREGIGDDGSTVSRST